MQLYIFNQSLRIGEFLSIKDVGEINCDTCLCSGIFVSIGGEPISDYLEMMNRFLFIKSIMSECVNLGTGYDSRISIRRDEVKDNPNVYLIEKF